MSTLAGKGLNPIRHLPALVGARHIVHVSRVRVNLFMLVIHMHDTSRDKCLAWTTQQQCITNYRYYTKLHDQQCLSNYITHSFHKTKHYSSIISWLGTLTSDSLNEHSAFSCLFVHVIYCSIILTQVFIKFFVTAACINVSTLLIL